MFLELIPSPGFLQRQVLFDAIVIGRDSTVMVSEDGNDTPRECQLPTR